MSAEDAAKAAWLAKTAPDWGPPGGYGGMVAATSPASGLLSSGEPMDIVHRPLSYFTMDCLTAKGTRRSQGSLVDVGEPHDFTRPISDGQWCGARAGSWACTPGGWGSPKLRPTTETFLVIDGEGCVTDADGMAHPFGMGDVVVLPKFWSGRWDISHHIHKLWVVHDHPEVPGAANGANGVVRAVVAPVPGFGTGTPVVQGALHSAPANMASTIYDVGPTRVGFLNAMPGSFAVAERPKAEFFFVEEGVFFLTNLDGSARRVVAGDSVVLPQGWAGHWDIVEPVRKVWIEAE